MTEKHYKYAPSPSAILRGRGTVVENSYYFVQNGELVLKDGSTVACDFEVGYMQDVSAWAVVYVSPENMPDKSRRRFDDHIRTSEKLTGVEESWGRNVTVTQLFWTGQKGSADWGEGDSGIRAVFAVGRFEISFKERRESTTRFFDLVNLPVHFSYSPEFSKEYDRADAAEKAFSIGVDAAITATLGASAENSLEEIRALAFEAAENAKKASLGGFLEWWFIPIKIGEDVFARLYWRRNPKELGYPLEPMSRLRLNTEKIPEGWEVEAVAEWLCALFSMALGRDIQWMHWNESSGEREVPPSYEVWQTRNIQQTRFVAFAEKPYDARFALEVGLHERDEGTLNFVGTVLAGLMQRDMIQIEPYLNALRNYISYAAVPALSYVVEGTLLVVLGDFIYRVWTEVNGTKYKLPSDKKKARKSIIDTANTAFSVFPLTEVDPFVPAKPGESISEHDSRRSKFIEAILNRFYKGVGYSQIDQFLWFFESYGYQADHYQLAERIVAFVESRNALVHEHCFHNEREGKPQEIGKEIANIRMIIPLMFSAILEYQGRYWDSYRDAWATTPGQP